MMLRCKILPSLVMLLLLAACGASGVTLPATLAPGQLPPAPDGSTPTPLPASGGTGGPTLEAVILPTSSPDPSDDRFIVGQSVEGRPIWGWRFGSGEQRIVLVGGIHGGFEANTTLLSDMLIDHFRENPAEVLPGIQLVIIPAANPDGLTRGASVPARFNANGVDLNRNWACEWSEEAELQGMAIDPGAEPFSELETRGLRDTFLSLQPAAVVFYHSAAGGVFMGACGDQHPAADWMGELLADSTGYPYGEFDFYEVTGDATNWLAAQGIPAAVIELLTQTEPEFTRNLAGVHALMCHFTTASPDDPAVARLCQ